jgi:hypothetical protein
LAKNKKGGPIPKAKLEPLDRRLRELYMEDGVTILLAAEIVSREFERNISNDYVGKQFAKFALEIAEEKQKSGDSWIEKIDKARLRALEGYSRKIKQSEKYLREAQTQLSKNKNLQDALSGEMLDTLRSSEIAPQIEEILGTLDQKAYMIFISAIRNQLASYAMFGNLVNQNLRELRAERIFIAEQQQQYDALEMQPPIQEVLDREIEMHIAQKQGLLKPAIEEQEKEIAKRK